MFTMPELGMWVLRISVRLVAAVSIIEKKNQSVNAWFLLGAHQVGRCLCLEGVLFNYWQCYLFSIFSGILQLYIFL